MKLKLTEEQRKQVLSAYENKELIELEVFEPEPKKIINLSMMAGSDIDMEFANSNTDDWYVYKLTSIDNEGFRADREGHNYKYGSRCRIRQDHPHANIWSECPLPEGLVVSTIDINSTVSGKITNYLDINWFEVIRFYVYGPADTHRYEWQKEK